LMWINRGLSRQSQLRQLIQYDIGRCLDDRTSRAQNPGEKQTALTLERDDSYLNRSVGWLGPPRPACGRAIAYVVLEGCESARPSWFETPAFAGSSPRGSRISPRNKASSSEEPASRRASRRMAAERLCACFPSKCDRPAACGESIGGRSERSAPKRSFGYRGAAGERQASTARLGSEAIPMNCSLRR